MLNSKWGHCLNTIGCNEPRNGRKLKALSASVMVLCMMAASARADISYDFAAGGGTAHRAYKDRIPSSPIPPTTNTIPATEFSLTNYARLLTSDNIRYATGNIGSGYRSASRFVFSIGQAPESVSSFTVLWEGRAQNGGIVHVYLWNAHQSAYELVGATTSTVDTNITDTVHSNPSHYIDGLGKMTVLAVNVWSDRGLTTDYLKMTIKQCEANDDCNDENACTNDACDSGVCTFVPRGGSCSDGNPCTIDDACVAGACISGTPPDCSSACDQCNTASCDPLGAVGNCDHHTPRPNGLPCEDGQFCTTGDACVAGVCRGEVRDCSAESDQCNNGTCNETTDSCEAVAVQNGTRCDDEVPCTQDDSCADGACDGTARNCDELTDSCNVGFCDEESGECRTRPVEDGTACDDGRFCTVSDVCTAGVCGGAIRDCSAHANQCNEGACDEDSDSCGSTPVADGTSCNDDAYCTIDDVCTAGACRGSQRDCTGVGNECNSGVCNEDSNACESAPVADGTHCDDGQYCTVNDACAAGVCRGGDRDCSDLSDSCNVGTCNEEQDVCQPRALADGTGCNDGFYCTINDACAAGACRGTERDCSGLTDACNVGTCDEEHNACQPRPKENGTTCDDGRFCTVEDACNNGLCLGASRDCSASGDQCNAASCDEKADACRAIPLPDGSSCDDDHYCTVEDSCTAGACGGTPRDCSGLSDQCHAGTCNEEAGSCEARPHADGTECDDELYCTIGDTCTAGACVGAARDCGSLTDQCNRGLCNEKVDQCIAQPLPDLSECTDLNACTVADVCLRGVCSSGAPTDCSFHDTSCSTAACNPDGEAGNCSVVTLVEDGTACDDGSYCTLGESCLSGQCAGGTTPCGSGQHCDEPGNACVECLDASHCDDGVGCTDDTCGDGVCLHRTNDEHCPDNGLHCDGSEYCDADAGCLSTGDPCPDEEFCDETNDSCGDCLVDSDCDDSVNCTVDRCISGGCTYTPEHGRCKDDGSFCTGAEVCDAVLGCLSTGNPCSEVEFCNNESANCDECRDNSDCDDGDPCTIGHACELGACRQATPVDCSAFGGECATASCNPSGETGNCDTITLMKNHTPCDDGSWCTVEDACTNGECGGLQRDCSLESDQCNIGVCDEDADSCTTQPVNEGISCSDGLFCTAGDVCINGVCTGEARDCSFASDSCNDGICDEEYNACVALPMDDGKPCQDHLFCTINEVCLKGICRGQIRACDEAVNQCNTATCNEKTNECVAIPVEDGSVCDDGNHCVMDEACHAGRCEGGTIRDCSAFDDQCSTAACDPDGPVGNCGAHTAVTDGTPCDDDSFCTIGDACSAGACLGSERDCSELADQCHVATCNEKTNECDVRAIADGTPCDDGAFCTTQDACTAGVCGGQARECDDTGDLCKIKVCNEESNTCDAAPVEDGTGCDDGIRCTIGDACEAGVCVGASRDCSELSDQCHFGACDEETGECVLRVVDDGTACDDGVRCTLSDACREGVCSGSPMDCSKLNDACNRGTCNEETSSCELRPLEDGIPCEDGLYCTVSEVCKSGVCATGGDRDCSDLTDQCNTGICSEETDACQVQMAEEGLACHDGLYCTVEDACSAGTCIGTARECGPATESCTISLCVEESDSCVIETAADGLPCDDGYECSTNDVCTDGACKGGRDFGLVQWSEIIACMAGISQAVAPDCECMDLDGDGHVDLIDADVFMRGFTGP